MNRIVLSSRSLWVLVLRHPYTVLGFLILIPLAVSFCLRTDSEWEFVFVKAARNLWLGDDIYRRTDSYLYPPFMAWAPLPFLALPAGLVRPAWMLVNIGCLVLAIRGAWSL